MQRHLRILSTAAFVCGLSVAGPQVSAEDLIVDLGRGPITVTVPGSYEPGSPLPLILVLHGYSGDHVSMENWWGMPARAEEYGFFVAHPEGTVDALGNRFWNATDACCNFFGSTVDDSQYLLDLISEISVQVDVDPRSISICGHSNGGFMSYRMACDHPDVIAAIGSMAGATWSDPLNCDPNSPVHTLQIHGTSDSVIRYNGGNINGNAYPSAIGSTEYWAGVGGCSPLPDTDFPPLDLVSSISGAETTISRYNEDCASNGSAELWTLAGAPHSPDFNESFSQLLVEFLLAHPKQEVAGTDTPLPEIAMSFLTSSPNPFSTSTSIEFQLDTTATVTGHVLTASGRRVRTLISSRSLPAGHHSVSWDGRSDGGQPLPAGAYFVHLSRNGEGHATRVIHIDG